MAEERVRKRVREKEEEGEGEREGTIDRGVREIACEKKREIYIERGRKREKRWEKDGRRKVRYRDEVEREREREREGRERERKGGRENR